MWKNVKSIPNIERHRRNSIKQNVLPQVSAHQFSVDCSRAHRGMFGGIMVIVSVFLTETISLRRTFFSMIHLTFIGINNYLLDHVLRAA